MIRLHNVSKWFGNQLILSEISLEIPADTCVCLIGRSGSGKSLLARIILGLEYPDTGSVQVHGSLLHPLAMSDTTSLYQDTGVVFQANALFDSLTVRENIGLRLDESNVSPVEAEHLVRTSLQKVGLDPSILSQLPAQLSGGMQKRVGIARAIVHTPSLLIYDEPTSGLDPMNADRIDRLIAAIQQRPGQTSLVITHDLDSVRMLADSIVLLDRGRIHFVGTWTTFLSSQDPIVKAFRRRQDAQKKPPPGGGSI